MTWRPAGLGNDVNGRLWVNAADPPLTISDSELATAVGDLDAAWADIAEPST